LVAHCHCRILGHGLEGQGLIFCCAHCARLSGVPELHDRVPFSMAPGDLATSP
jgi:hypothetical protein